MADVILVATIVAFFLAAALLVRVLGRGIVDPAADTDSADADPADADPADADDAVGADSARPAPAPGRPR